MNEIEAVARRLIADGDCTPRPARDPVNVPMVRNWTEALGDANPAYPDLAPPAMAQVWTMPGLHGQRSADDPLAVMTAVLDEAGYTSVVATNCEQTYARYLRPGEHVAVRSRLTDVVGPKRTALGDGWFVTTVSTWTVDEEPVAEMMFRVLKFRPPDLVPPRDVLRPVVNRDTAFFWEGAAAGELRVQRCGACEALRHPPGPMCPRCGATDPSYLVASGRGEVYSYVVHHHPPVPGREPPFVVAVVELEEGVRVLGELHTDPERARIGMPVEVVFDRIDGDLTLPAWRPR
ncbi:bifunctional MaoC family dehydratase N-terminal/OB-fold nucleic acid binding domain-containing protein [Pseudonocardia sp. DSM 110487]|uniref:bifunctional MaoC family dehydratase N-terminal/OB-fold nucleic acid binding domain-containing protein n=1 Tax=Pseudonocardia sp. DSM 110487 TaxID=2865833 RepID=UPI002105E72D|nr:bifunctional MaoC family dehydratase N-terminal/OB-fold nucleic acid binding domain-containing protein [Pseudonocardia sp. DSM 110487]